MMIKGDMMCLSSSEMIIPVIFLALFLFFELQDLGIGIMAPFVAKSDEEYEAVRKLLRPGIDGNELWLFLGLFLIGQMSMQKDSYPTMFYLVAAVAAVSLFLRASVVYICPQKMETPVARIVSIVSFITLAFIGLFLFSIGNVSAGLLTASGIFGTLWLLTASIQLGAVYGAFKSVNPLAERWRALSLVVLLVSMICFLIWAIIEIVSVSNLMADNYSLWIMAFISFAFSVISFTVIRLRLVGRGLLASYVLLLSELVLFVFISTIYGIITHTLDGNSILMMMEFYPINVWMVVIGIWTLMVFVWKIWRKKINYLWNDHI